MSFQKNSPSGQRHPRRRLTKYTYRNKKRRACAALLDAKTVAKLARLVGRVRDDSAKAAMYETNLYLCAGLIFQHSILTGDARRQVECGAIMANFFDSCVVPAYWTLNICQFYISSILADVPPDDEEATE